MIYYRPTDGDVENNPITLRPRTCFVMTKLGKPVAHNLISMREEVIKVLKQYDYSYLDANSLTTGKDFLLKIWKMTVGVPLGIALIDESINHQTMANIFYELGWMQSMGKETIVIKSKELVIPSDFIRTEYINFDDDFTQKFESFLSNLDEQAEYYSLLASNLENNPLLSLDYYRRAFLITNDKQYQDLALKLLSLSELNKRSKTSVELLHFGFATGIQQIKI